jgi:hypothetical protein
LTNLGILEYLPRLNLGILEYLLIQNLGILEFLLIFAPKTLILYVRYKDFQTEDIRPDAPMEAGT